MPRNCRGHPHPHSKPVSRAKVRAELERMWDAAGKPGEFSLEWTDGLARTHDRDQRRYAQVAPFAMEPAFELAPQAVYLPPKNRRGLLAHEVGHVLDPSGSEGDADRAAAAALGIDVAYDRRWPGKGLQVALNPKNKNRACEVLFEDPPGQYAWKKGTAVGFEGGMVIVKVGGQTHKRISQHVRGCAPVRKSASGRSRKTKAGVAQTPPFRYQRRVTGRNQNIVEISMVALSSGRVLGTIKFKKGSGNKAYVQLVEVDQEYRGHYVATSLYEEAAKEVWGGGQCLASDTTLRVGSRAFWEKQVSKGRADKIGDRYVLCAPPPKTLKNPPRFPVQALWGVQRDPVTVLGHAWPEDDRYLLILTPWGDEVVAAATEIYSLEGKQWREPPPLAEGRQAWANPPHEYPLARPSSFDPVLVPDQAYYPPVNLDPVAAWEGRLPLVYKPGRAREIPALRQAHEAMLERLPSGQPKAMFEKSWYDLIARAGLSATVYVLDRNGWLWKLVDVLDDPGPYGTGSLVLQALGPQSHRFPHPITRPIQQVVSSGAVPIVQYKPLPPLPRSEAKRLTNPPGLARRALGWVAAGAVADLVSSQILGSARANPPREIPPCDPSGTGRALDAKTVKGEPVRVHVNLHNGCYVVSHRGLVAGYAKSLTLKSVLPKVSMAGWKKCSDTKTRNVHAFVQGVFTKGSASAPEGSGWRKISYSCKDRGPNFYYTDDGSVFEGAEEVRFVRGKGEGFSQIVVYAKGKAPRKNNPGCPCSLPGGACRCGSVDRWWIEPPPGCGSCQ